MEARHCSPLGNCLWPIASYEALMLDKMVAQPVNFAHFFGILVSICKHKYKWWDDWNCWNLVKSWWSYKGWVHFWHMPEMNCLIFASFYMYACMQVLWRCHNDCKLVIVWKQNMPFLAVLKLYAIVLFNKVMNVNVNFLLENISKELLKSLSSVWFWAIYLQSFNITICSGKAIGQL